MSGAAIFKRKQEKYQKHISYALTTGVLTFILYKEFPSIKEKMPCKENWNFS
jgi:hypothetical protein